MRHDIRSVVPPQPTNHSPGLAPGLRKPDAAIFEHVLATLAVPAAQCVFIDDLRPNLRAAARLGLRTLHARDDRTFLADLFALLGDPVPTPPNTPARL